MGAEGICKLFLSVLQRRLSPCFARRSAIYCGGDHGRMGARGFIMPRLQSPRLGEGRAFTPVVARVSRGVRPKARVKRRRDSIRSSLSRDGAEKILPAFRAAHASLPFSWARSEYNEGRAGNRPYPHDDVMVHYRLSLSRSLCLSYRCPPPLLVPVSFPAWNIPNHEIEIRAVLRSGGRKT